jgi:type I pantothenate kinase
MAATGADDPAYDELARAAASLVERPGARLPVLFGIAGAVGVGKSTTAEIIRGRLRARGVAVEVVATDGFLFPNAELERRLLTLRKGFPESFDHEALVGVLARLREAAASVEVPRYSHQTYDRVPGPGRVLAPAQVVIVEGVDALQEPVAGWLDIALYIEAGEADLRAWFVSRFLDLCREADRDPTHSPFYASFSGVAEADRRAVADSAWDQINAVNLREHIAPSRARATHVLEKSADHSVRALTRAQ